MKKIIFNKTNILLFLLVAALILLMVILLKLKVTSVKESTVQEGATEKVIINKEEYKKNILSILDEYEQVVKAADIYATSTKPSLDGYGQVFQQIDDLKNDILNIKAPSMEYKDLHMNLMMSLLSIEDYLEVPVHDKNIACVDSVEKVKKSRELLLD